MKMYRLLGILCLALTLVFAVGCGAKDAKLDTVKYVLETEPATLDPALSTGLPESQVELQIFEGLVRLDAKDQPQPGVAKRWDISPDGLTYTFYLREDAKWSDGSEVTALDFVYAWTRVLTPATASQNAYMLYPIKNAEAFYKGKAAAADLGVKAIDKRTLQVVLETPAPYFLGLTAFHAYYPVPEKVVSANPTKWASDAKGLVSNGPFVLTEWKHSSELKFKKNDHYWDKGKVKLAGMEWPISESQATRLNMVESNQANMMTEPPGPEQDRLTKEGIMKITPISSLTYYVFNTQKAPFDNPLVRKAFSMAIEREALVKNVMKGGKKAAYALVPPGMINPATGKDFREEGGNYVKEDVAEAQRLLKEAGYNESNPFPKVTLLYNTNETHKALAEAVQAMLKKNLGVDVALMNQETKVFLASRNRGEFQIARANWVGDYADPMTFISVFSDPENDALYNNPTYNAFVKMSDMTQDPAARMTAMHEAEKLLFQDSVIMPVAYSTHPYIARPYIKGYAWSILALVDFKEAYIE